MVFDTISNRRLYAGLSSRIYEALAYLEITDFKTLSPGRYIIDSDNLFALVQEYESIPREQAKWEYHRKYIDIQYIDEGIEQIGFGKTGKMAVTVEYDPATDISFLKGDGDYVTLEKGSFGIFYPDDAHQPKVAPSGVSGKVRKVVVKVKVD
ncbi:DUF386 domain-containing protein [bacterium]|nr:DUF386 domain-containing protein [bacterium]